MADDEDVLTYRLHDTDSGGVNLTEVVLGYMPALLIRITEKDGDFAIQVDHSAPAEGELELLEMYQDVLMEAALSIAQQGIIEAREAGAGDD